MSVIHYQMRAFRLFGLLPAENLSFLYSLLGVLSFFIGGIGIVFCQILSILYVQSTDDLIKELLLFCTTSTVAMKIILIHLRRQHLLNILDIMKTTDKRVENYEDINKMKDVYAYCRRVTIFYSSIYIGAILTLCFEVIFLDKFECTWKSTALIPNDFVQQPTIYYSVLLFEAIANTLNCSISWALDTFSFLLISLLCGHIEVLSLHLKNIGNLEKRSARQKKRLLDYLNHYNLLYEYVFRLRDRKKFGE